MASHLPRVKVLATGGTITGAGPHRLDFSHYTEIGRQIPIREILERLPEIGQFAVAEGEQTETMWGTAVGPHTWLRLSQQINEALQDDKGLAGVVVTHGTATLEETAYFLNLTVHSTKPVVVAGAQRPVSALGTDAEINLLDAIRIATSPEAVGKGVLTVLNNEIHSAREVTKNNTLRLETFKPNELGFLGYADSDGQVVFYRSPTRKHTIDSEFDVSGLEELPRIDILYTYAGADALLVEALMGYRVAGIVVAGLGSGAMTPAMEAALVKAAAQGMPVVVSSRTGQGRVVMTPKKEEAGFIVADNLTPQKARVLLMLGLTRTREGTELQRMFNEY